MERVEHYQLLVAEPIHQVEMDKDAGKGARHRCSGYHHGCPRLFRPLEALLEDVVDHDAVEGPEDGDGKEDVHCYLEVLHDAPVCCYALVPAFVIHDLKELYMCNFCNLHTVASFILIVKFCGKIKL